LGVERGERPDVRGVVRIARHLVRVRTSAEAHVDQVDGARDGGVQVEHVIERIQDVGVRGVTVVKTLSA